MDGWDDRWEHVGNAHDFGYSDVPSNGDSGAEYFQGLFYGAWYESILTFYFEDRIAWTAWRTTAVPQIRRGVVQSRMRYLLYWRKRGGEWREVDGVNALIPGVSGVPGGIEMDWQDAMALGRRRTCYQLRWWSWDEPQRIYWDHDHIKFGRRP